MTLPSGGTSSPIATGTSAPTDAASLAAPKEANDGRDVVVVKLLAAPLYQNSRCSRDDRAQASLNGLPTWAPTKIPTWLPTQTGSFNTVWTVCRGHDPKRCGCGSVNQMDYRGLINTTKSGAPCVRWDEDWIQDFLALEFLRESEGADYWVEGASPEDGNFCRNPQNHEEMAWCFTEEGVPEQCNVPYCILPQSACSSLDSDDGDVTKELEDACAFHECVYSGYSHIYPDDSRFPFREDVRSSCICPWEIYNGKYGSQTCDIFECCDESKDLGWRAAGCKCSLEIDCEENESARGCSEFARHCCGTDYECMCEYEIKACRLAAGEVTEHCDKDQDDEECRKAKSAAEDLCAYTTWWCCDNEHNIGSCACDHWELLCNDFPNSKNPDFCQEASHGCCGNPHCYCDFVTYVENALDYRDQSFNSDNQCADVHVSPDHADEELSLQGIYNGTGGGRWYNSEGWMSELDHCTWYGIDCDDEGHVTKIDLRSNNMTGDFPSSLLSKLYRLHTLDLSDNQLWGIMAVTEDKWVNDTSSFFKLRELKYVDLSQNNLTGEVDVLFAPAAEYVNFSHNSFSTVNSFKKFKPSQDTLLSCDLSHNYIGQNVKDIMTNVPPNIERLILSNNLIEGALPSILEKLARLRHFDLGSNRLSGELPDFSAPFPNLQVLNLSNEKQGENTGLTGTLPNSLSNLPFLTQLSLAGNGITSTIPPVLGNLVLLRVLDLSDNALSETIPAELGRLGRGSEGALDRIDLSDNMLEGTIPVEFRLFEGASVLLHGNEQMEAFAPLSLCLSLDFDLQSDPVWCPLERGRLVQFYNLAKGGEWTESGNWTDEYVSHCLWFGVTCDDSNSIVELNLTNNGLSGKLDGSIGYFPSLNRLDLSDNDIKGPIPPEVGLLSNLTALRIAHNSFTGTVPEMLNLHQLQMIQLHGNRLKGTIANVTIIPTESDSSFIADCGVPSDFGDPIDCAECTMCCNSKGDCYPTQENRIQKAGFIDYINFAGSFLGCTVGFSFALALAVAVHDRYKHRDSPTPRRLQRTVSTLDRDKKYSIETIGDDSVYKFFLGRSWAGWIVAFVIVGVQLWLLFVFIEGAEIDWTSETSDLVFSYKCPRDEAECNDTSDLTPQGWVAFGILMAAHVLKDIINGLKLIVLSGRSSHDIKSKARFFLGGTLLFAVSSFTLLTSALYNRAIATSDTEVIMNSVVILFIMEVDEYCHDILFVLNLDQLGEKDKTPSEAVSGMGSPDDMDGSRSGIASCHEIQSQSAGSQSFDIEMESLKHAVQALGEDVKYLKKENLELKRQLEV